MGGGPAALGGPNGAHLVAGCLPWPAVAMWGLVPHGLAKEDGLPPSPLNRGPPMPWNLPQFSPFFSPTLSVVLLLELRTRREVSLLYTHRRAAKSTLPLPLLCWIWSPEVVIGVKLHH